MRNANMNLTAQVAASKWWLDLIQHDDSSNSTAFKCFKKLVEELILVVNGPYKRLVTKKPLIEGKMRIKGG